MTTAQDDTPEASPAAPAVGIRIDRSVGRQVPKRAGLLAQIEACRREVASWPAWMRATTSAPKWMEGWDD